MDPRLVGGIIGCVLGLVGGGVGTYFGSRSTFGPRERAFMVRVAIAAWVLITAFVIGVRVLPPPFNFLLWGPYVITLPLAIVWCNRRQQTIRGAEPREKEPEWLSICEISLEAISKTGNRTADGRRQNR